MSSVTFDEYFPFDPSYGAAANSTRWRKMGKLWAADGVVANWPAGSTSSTGQLFATITGSTVTVQPGAVFIHGCYAEIGPAAKTLTVQTTGTIVAQVDLTNEIVHLVYRDGITDYGNSPTTGFEQDDTNFWEIPIWMVNAGVLTDLRVFVQPVAGLNWWANSIAPPAAALAVATGTSSQQSFMTARIPYPGRVLVVGNMLLTFTDLSQAQNAQCSITHQYGVAGQQFVSPAMIPAITGGGVSGQMLTMTVGTNAVVPVTQGKKTFGWRVTAGSPGPGIQISNLTLSATMIQVAATA